MPRNREICFDLGGYNREIYDLSEEDYDEDYGSRRGVKRNKSSEEEDGDDEFIVTDLPDERRRFLSREEEDEDVEDLERRIQERFTRHHEYDDEEEDNDVEQQALLPSVVRDPKLWMVKCTIGREREAAVYLMQKFDHLQIKSVVALDNLKNYIYIEADEEAHVKEAIKGMRNIYANQKILLVPIKEITQVLAWMRNLKGWVEKVDEDNVLIRSETKGLPNPLVVNERELCKYFQPGN